MLLKPRAVGLQQGVHRKASKRTSALVCTAVLLAAARLLRQGVSSRAVGASVLIGSASVSVAFSGRAHMLAGLLFLAGRNPGLWHAAYDSQVPEKSFVCGPGSLPPGWCWQY